MIMRLKITKVNFTTNHDWIFQLVDENGNNLYIMNDAFYNNHKLKSPLTKKELDSYDRGHWINASVEYIGDKGVVVSI